MSLIPRARTEYVVIRTTLRPDAFGNRRKTIDVFGDRVFIDTVRTTADITKLYYGVDDKELIPASLSTELDISPQFFRQVKLEWTSENDNKDVVLIIGREASLRIRPLQGVGIVYDYVNLAREPTLQAIKSQTDKLVFDSASNLKIDNANYEVMAPVDVQAVFKSKATLFSGTVSASGNTADIDFSNYTVVEIELKVTSVSGTNPTLSVYIEGKFEDTGDYKPLVYQENITGTGIWFFTITKLAFRYIRVRWVVSGTSPSFTFTVVAQMSVL